MQNVPMSDAQAGIQAIQETLKQHLKTQPEIQILQIERVIALNLKALADNSKNLEINSKVS